MNRIRCSCFLAAALLIPLVVAESRGQLSLQVDPSTGFVQLVNDPLVSIGSVSFDYYEIKSDTGSLNPGGWQSLTSQSFPGWSQLGGSNANLLGEANLTGSTELALGQSLSLGTAYKGLAGIPDLTFAYAIAGGGLFDGPVSYVGGPPIGIAGDYNFDGIVSHADYSVLGDTFGSTANLAADGDGSGIVDMVDYQIYQANFGSSEGGGNGGFPGGILPFSLSANTTPEGNIVWFVHFGGVQGSLAGQLHIATNGAPILSAAADESFQDDGAAPVGVPGFAPGGGIATGILTSGPNLYAALGSTLGAPSPGADRQFLTFTTAGSLATEISIQGRYGYQGVEYSLSGLFSYGAGSSPVQPVLPSETNPGEFVFQDVPGGLWFDPPLVDSFEYVMDSASLFTAILDFPPGFAAEFAVTAENTLLGEFGPGDSVDFVALLGHGVERFIVSNITPLADAADPNAFPLKLAFNTPTASFRMLAVPEPGTIVLTVLGLACTLLRWRQSDGYISIS